MFLVLVLSLVYGVLVAFLFRSVVIMVINVVRFVSSIFVFIVFKFFFIFGRVEVFLNDIVGVRIETVIGFRVFGGFSLGVSLVYSDKKSIVVISLVLYLVVGFLLGIVGKVFVIVINLLVGISGYGILVFFVV